MPYQKKPRTVEDDRIACYELMIVIIEPTTYYKQLTRQLSESIQIEESTPISEPQLVVNHVIWIM